MASSTASLAYFSESSIIWIFFFSSLKLFLLPSRISLFCFVCSSKAPISATKDSPIFVFFSTSVFSLLMISSSFLISFYSFSISLSNLIRLFSVLARVVFILVMSFSNSFTAFVALSRSSFFFLYSEPPDSRILASIDLMSYLTYSIFGLSSESTLESSLMSVLSFSSLSSSS